MSGLGGLRAQLLWLAWFAIDAKKKHRLFLQIDGLRQPAVNSHEPDDHEAQILEAILCGQDSIATSRLRLLASQRGVEHVLAFASGEWQTSDGPILNQRFRRCLQQWRSAYPLTETKSAAPVCVVITTYNPDIILLGMALESLLYQVQPPQEILIIDDASRMPVKPRLQSLLHQKSWFQTKLNWIRNHYNHGQYVCRNMAASFSSQPYLAIQDDDDISHPMRIKYQWDCARSGFLVNYCSHIRLAADSGSLQADGGSNRFLGDGIATLFVNRKIIQKMGGFYPVRSRGDVEFRSRLSQAYGSECIFYGNQPLYLLRGSDRTISSAYEYGCSRRIKIWRQLVKKGFLV
jgi:hypothetical protein